jgi:NAD(P)-dependent dehydrogenase (short-subunit alcohol dehydrogenase family)
MPVDLSDFRSIEKFAAAFEAKGCKLDVLINNAGIMMPPDAKTPQGFEVTLATNYFGPVYLTQLLLDKLTRSAPARIVWVCSALELPADIDWEDLRGANSKRSTLAYYCRSKLYKLIAAQEVHAQLQAAGNANVECFISQPGFPRTDLLRKADKTKFFAVFFQLCVWGFASPASRNSWSTIYTATAPELSGRGGSATMWGPPLIFLPLFETATRLPINGQAKDAVIRQRLYAETRKIIQDVAARAENVRH